MADYEQLYWDSQYEIKKLKKQIELLENEIAVQRETKNSKARKVINNELNRYLKKKTKK